MAPEQALGEHRLVGAAADVYALGGVLYFLLTGQPPFQAARAPEVLRQVADCPVVPPRSLVPSASPELEAICLKCLEKEQAKRYPSAAAVAEALRQVGASSAPMSGGSTLAEKSETVHTAPGRTPGHRRLVAGLVVVGAVLLVVAAWLGHVFLGGNSPRPTQGQVAAKLPPLELPEPSRRDFSLTVELLDGRPGQQGVVRLVEGQTVRFRVEVGEDAYVGIWDLRPDGTVMALFPHADEPNNLLKKKVPRTIPEEYEIVAEKTRGRAWVVASTKPWAPVHGESLGPFQVYRQLEQRTAWEEQLNDLRDLVPRPRAKGPKEKKPRVAEEALRYEVVPR
jgi:hypothetical protein